MIIYMYKIEYTHVSLSLSLSVINKFNDCKEQN